MTYMQTLILGAAFTVAPFAWAGGWKSSGVPEFDVLVLGEVHDNPAHHDVQVQWLEAFAVKAVVFEMLTPEEAIALSGVARTPEAMAQAVDGFHWSNIADYSDVLAASSEIIGAALPRDTVRAAFSETAAEVFRGDAVAFGLTEPLPKEEAHQRAQLQFKAHCEAMPIDMMGGMIEAQRLRDAEFSRAVLDALETFGSPVVLITGNGHARTDWGVPSYLRRVAPHLEVFAIGQSESGALGGPFDDVADAPAVVRSDPCAAFK